MSGAKPHTTIHSVYIPKLDAEHKKLSQAVEELHEAMTKEGFTSETQAIFRELAGDIASHLAGEERMMRSTNYPSYAWHKQQHDAVRKRLKACSRSFVKEDAAAVEQLLDFFVGWLSDHTGLHDRMMSAYLRNFQRARSRSVS